MTQTPTNSRIYAIGDVHGKTALLHQLYEKILTDSQSFKGQLYLVFMGDYIDRGTQSQQALTFLSETDFTPFKTTFLLGNHEQALLQFLETPKKLKSWYERWGGLSTLQSYQIVMSANTAPEEIATQLKANMPEKHLFFLKSLESYKILGDYLFVHAGVKPKKSIEKQKLDDLLMIREGFLNQPHHLPYKVVFGHTIQPEPLVEDDRIGIDTGAYMGGPLTAVVLEGTDIRFLQAL